MNLKTAWVALGLGGICAAAMALPAEADPAAIRSVMTRVADWQLDNPSDHHPADWTHGALYAGLAAWAQMAESEKYDAALLAIGQKNNWQPHNRIYHADDHVVGQMYLEMYKTHHDPAMLEGIQKRFDFILAHPSPVTLKFGQKYDTPGVSHLDRWDWCDALFMAPPVWAKLARITGDHRYLEFMNKEWWATTDYLYDQDEHLFFRDDRYFTQREANGKKVFWSRGNGWVLGGLVRVLEEMPSDYPDRPRYEKLYRQMAAKLAAIQPEDGLWRPSLLDPASYPAGEASGTGFYCYGLAWGINHGYLDASDYLPVVIKAWKGLVGCVHPDGKLGFVQPIGADPRQVNADQTEIYGVGAFLLAGSEVYKIAIRSGNPVQAITVVNPIEVFRPRETITLNWQAVEKTVPGLSKDNAAIYEFKSNRLLVTQWVQEGDDTTLLFQTDLAPGEQKYFWLLAQPDALAKAASTLTTFCRFVPERKDDFAWENDKVVFRMYGPALESETITSGIDAWGKCVPDLVIDKFIGDDRTKKISYHEDHGQGGDFYKVGNTLGCGGMAPFVSEKVVLSRNFAAWKVLANGPIRSTFELTYKPWQVGSRQVSETKRISIDLGSNLNRIECRYSGAEDDTDPLPLAAGIVLAATSDKTWEGNQTIGYWLPADSNAGFMGCGVVFGDACNTTALKADNHWLLTIEQPVGQSVVYYAGSCWDKNKAFDSFEKWQDYLTQFKKRIDNPVVVKITK